MSPIVASLIIGHTVNFDFSGNSHGPCNITKFIHDYKSLMTEVPKNEHFCNRKRLIFYSKALVLLTLCVLNLKTF